jgi:hypothetical protein
VPDVGRVCLVDVTRKMLVSVDDLWPYLRFQNDMHKHWRWLTIMDDAPEQFALIDKTDDVVALWCSGKKRPLKLPEATCYRLDRIEIHPKLRGGAMGLFAFALVAARALEVGSDGIVLAAIPAVRRFYQAAGGEERLADGWISPPGLVPFFFPREALSNLKEMTDAYAVED